MRRVWLRASWPLLLLPLLACGRPVDDGPGPPSRAAAATLPAAAQDTVADVDGKLITRGELDKKVEGRLAQVRQEEYEIRHQALEELISDSLLEKEARARGVSRADLLKDEVDRQVKGPSPEEVEDIYSRNKARFASRPKAAAVAEIEKALREREKTQRRDAFAAQLRTQAKVRISLEPPRLDVPFSASAPVYGPAKAPVTIVEFTDYQCPYCHKAETTIERVLSQFSGKVRLVHRDFPLDGHAQAKPAARAARCAGEQGRFWDYHRSLMSLPGDLSAADLEARAGTLKLDPTAFSACLASDRFDASIQESLEAGLKAGVTGTPAYFINGRMLTGARPYDDFREVIESELTRGG